MLAVLQLPDRTFFHSLAEAAATNPFSDAYVELQLQIADCAASLPEEERLQCILERVNERVRKLESAGMADVRRFEGDDRELVRRALLFDMYHRFLPALDDLIVRQAVEERPLPVAFAGQVLELLVRRGFPREEALRYFAIFYQIRRAFYFIDRGLVGRSESMKQLRLRLWNNVFTHDIRLYERRLWNRMEDFSTLLLGETGTGKGAAAAAVGRSGFIPFEERKCSFAASFAGGFTSLNLSQFPETLIESELFGHRKGAFTGAVEAHEGILARCSPYGAIFLDEIGDAGIPVQIKLLHVLQERTFSPVGSHEKLRFRGRVIAATNQPIDRLRRSGRFRDDFFYRLCSDVITVPSLRQRIAENPAELDDLIALIVHRLTGSAAPEAAALARSAIDSSLGRNYSWPGNVRELEQAVRRILLTREYRGDPGAACPGLSESLQAGLAGGTLDAETLLAGYCALLYERHQSYQEVARRTNLDRRTVKSYVEKQAGRRESRAGS